MVGQTEQISQPTHEPTQLTKRFTDAWQRRIAQSPFTTRVAKAARLLIPSAVK